MKILKALLLLLVLVIGEQAQVYADYKPDSLNQEVDAALAFLSNFDTDTQSYIKFFSIYNIPEQGEIYVPSWSIGQSKTLTMREAYIKTLNFTINSLNSEPNIVLVQPVTFLKDGQTYQSPTLYWIDIRELGWTNQAWETVSLQEPYFREPWINYNQSLALRILSGNAIVRADWFIVSTLDTSKQFDLDNKSTPLYYVLLYARTGIPKNVTEFRDRWLVNASKIEENHLPHLVVVDKGDSGVAIHNRQLAHARTEVGYYYETSDVKTNIVLQDYIENLQPSVLARNDRDAGEQISSNFVGLQVYLLTDGKGNRIESADPGVAFDKASTHDIRVKTARSCIICHANGLNLATDGLAALLEDDYVRLKSTSKEFQKLLQSSYFRKAFNTVVEEDNLIYKEAVFQVNGLSPAGNASCFKQVVDLYDYKDVSLEMAYTECGVDELTFKEYCSEGVGGRLNGLFNGNDIPRDVWDSVKGGTFFQAMLLLNRENIPRVIEQQKVEKEQEEIVLENVNANTVIGKVAVVQVPVANLIDGGKIKYTAEKGRRFNIIEEKDGLLLLRLSNNEVVSILKTDVNIQEPPTEDNIVGKTATILKDKTNLVDGNTIKYKANQGQTFKITAQSGIWTQIELANKEKIWVLSDDISVSE